MGGNETLTVVAQFMALVVSCFAFYRHFDRLKNRKKSALPPLAICCFLLVLPFGLGLFKDTGTAASHYQRGRQYFFEHDRTSAITEAKSAIQLDPSNIEAHKLLGACYGEDGNLSAAAAEYQDAASTDPTDMEAQLGLAESLEAIGDIPGAEQGYTRILKGTTSTLTQKGQAQAELKGLQKRKVSA